MSMHMSFQSRKQYSRASQSKSRSTSSQGIKLRTILKGRGSQQGQIQERYIEKSSASRKQLIDNNRQFDEDNKKMSSSMRLNQVCSRVSLTHSVQSAGGGSTARREETLNCQQQLLGNLDVQAIYQKLMAQLDQLDKQAQLLIMRKIKKLSKRSGNISLKDKGRDQTSHDIQNLIERVKELKANKLQKIKGAHEKVRNFHDKKIQLLQKLLASHTTQSEVLKRYFFAISALNSKEKSIRRTDNKGSTVYKNSDQKFFLVPINPRSKTQPRQKQMLCKQTSNKLAYLAPKVGQYETYRYKAKDYSANLQPLPRSSYKSEYLVYNQKGVQPMIKNLDNHTYLNNSRLVSSTYAKDYQRMKAEIINYKELDSYKNKFKNLQVSFFNTNKQQQSRKQFEESKKFITEQMQTTLNDKMMKMSKQNTREKQIISRLKNAYLNTQAKSQYRGQQKQINNNIKNRRLNHLKYAYKTLANE